MLPIQIMEKIDAFALNMCYFFSREQGYIPSNYVRRQGLESERYVF